MHQNARRKRPTALRHESVERQRNLTRLRELDVLLQAGEREGFVGGLERDGEQKTEQDGEFHGHV